MYAKRRIRDYFKEKKGLEDASKIAREFQHGLESLEMLQRQVWDIVQFMLTSGCGLGISNKWSCMYV